MPTVQQIELSVRRLAGEKHSEGFQEGLRLAETRQSERVCGNCKHWIDTGGTEAGDPSGKCKRLAPEILAVVASYDAEFEWLHTPEAFDCNRFEPKDGD